MALDLDDAIVMVHVMPTALRRVEVNKPTKYQLGPNVGEGEELHDSQGRLTDDAYVDAAVEDAIAQVRGRGRPSLSTSGESPSLRVRP